jgi:uncharacterized FlaG/YvyC family protein
MKQLQKEIKSLLKSLKLKVDFEGEQRNGIYLVTVYDVPPNRIFELYEKKPDEVVFKFSYR